MAGGGEKKGKVFIYNFVDGYVKVYTFEEGVT